MVVLGCYSEPFKIVRLKSLRLAFKIGYVVLPTTIESFSDNGFRGMNENGTGRNYF